MRATSPLTVLLVVLAVAASGCLKVKEGPAGGASTERLAPIVLTGEAQKEAGKLVGTTLLTFEVPDGVRFLGATLEWREPPRIQFTLKGPDGTVESSLHEKSGRASLAVRAAPVPGTWEARVTSSSESKVPFTLTVTLDDKPAERRTLTAVVNLVRGGVAEANLLLEPGQPVKWSYEANRNVRWDIHTHDPETGSVSTPAQGSGTTNDGTFTPTSPGLYSFAWTASEGDASVTYTLEGVYRVHSYHRD